MAAFVSKEHIEKTFLRFYAEGRACEFFLADHHNDLKGFPSLHGEDCKKLKDVAVSLIRAGLLDGKLTKSRDGSVASVTISDITADGLDYLRSLK